MKPETIYKRRLLRLARHLLHNKLGHKVFDFSTYNTNKVEDLSGNIASVFTPKCGTNGCAIGECPIVFPKSWTWDHVGMPVTKQPAYCTREVSRNFFGLNQYSGEYERMFVPVDAGYAGILPSNASRYDVAKGIIRFVQEKHGNVRLTIKDKQALTKSTHQFDG